jgi:hypothetical protein
MRLHLTPLLLLAALAARDAAASNHVFSVGSSSSADPHACGPRSVGLVDGETAKWVPGSCIAADDWVGDAETATALDSGVVVVYTNPGFGQDTNFYFVDFKSKNVSRVLIGGDQGEMRCVTDAGKLSCYGVTPGDDNDATQLIQVDGLTGDSRPVLNLTNYEGYSVGGSAIDPVKKLYHFVAVGNPHIHAESQLRQPMVARRRCKRGSPCPPPPSSRTAPPPSDQWLVTINLERMTIVAEAPLSRNFMGPLSVSEAHVRRSDAHLLLSSLHRHRDSVQGLASFNAEGYNGLVAVDYATAKLRPLLLADFGSIVQFCGAFSRNFTFAASAYPSPTRFYAVGFSAAGAARLAANTTFESEGVVYAAGW